jgi:hypothetical protein
MRRAMIALGALGLLAATALPAPAAWNNVFQPTLFHRNRPAQVTQYYVPPVVAQSPPVVAQSSPCDTCQQTSCSTSYVQRCYYQPVTVYQTQSYYEPVTTYRTSYYYEPVTTYRYSCYYDPCSCSYQQVATPCTSYQLRSQCCPVQSWVQRCCQVPVTTYQKSCYWQPQTTCCTTTQGNPIPMTTQPPVVTQPQTVQPPLNSAPPGAGAPPGTGAVPSITNPGSSGYPPSVYEQRTFGTGNGNGAYDKFYPPSQPAGPTMPPASLKQQPPAPALKLEGIAMTADSYLQGQVVHNDRSPQASAKVMFRNHGGQSFVTTANTAGRFSVSLPSGTWQVFLYGADDLPVLSTQLQITGSKAPPVNVVSR